MNKGRKRREGLRVGKRGRAGGGEKMERSRVGKRGKGKSGKKRVG